MRKWILALALVQSGANAQQVADLPKDQNVLFWTQDQRDTAFRAMERIAKANTIAAGGPVLALQQGKPVKLELDVDAFMQQAGAFPVPLQAGKAGRQTDRRPALRVAGKITLDRGNSRCRSA